MEFADNKKTVTQAWNVERATFFVLSLFSRNREYFNNFSYQMFYSGEICYDRSHWLKRVVIKHSNGSKTVIYRESVCKLIYVQKALFIIVLGPLCDLSTLKFSKNLQQKWLSDCHTHKQKKKHFNKPRVKIEAPTYFAESFK